LSRSVGNDQFTAGVLNSPAMIRREIGVADYRINLRQIA
jgi:hypothetical protein